MKSLVKMLAAGMMMVNLSVFAVQPYDSVRNLPATPYYVQDGYVIYSLLSLNKGAVVVDVESLDGGLARYIAQQAANLPSLTTVYSVSEWRENDPSQKHAFQRFLSNVKQESTTGLIIPIRMSSLEAASGLNITADFISVVGANDGEKIYRDILAWYPHLSNGGVICGNNWYDSSVELGVTKASVSLDMNLQINDNVWYFQKPAQ